MKAVVNLLALWKLAYQTKKIFFRARDGKYVGQLLVLMETQGLINYYYKETRRQYRIFNRINSSVGHPQIQICYKQHQRYLQPFRDVNWKYYRGQHLLVLKGNRLELIRPAHYEWGDIVARFY